MSLAEARDERDAKRKLIAKGIGPVELKREEAAAKRDEKRAIFSAAAEGFFRKKQANWSDTHRRDVRRMIDGELVPALGSKSLAAITTADVRKMLDKIAERGAIAYAHDVRMYFRAILRHANSERPHTAQLADPSVHVTIDDAPDEVHHAKLVPQDIGPFLRKLAFSDATPLVRIATRLLLLTAVRTSELRCAPWSEIDVKEKLWTIPAERMKAGRPHIVPLSPQVLALLAELRTISGECDLLLPSFADPHQPISNNTILFALYRLGYKGRLTGHGFRSMFSTWAHTARTPEPERTPRFLSDAIELQLAHVQSNKEAKGAYLATAFIEDRTRMLDAWASYLDAAEQDSATAVPLRLVFG